MLRIMAGVSRRGSLLTSPQDPSHAGGDARTGFIWSALGAVYIVWGSTYLAIRVVVETIPPLLSASARFVLAGAVLYAFTIRRGDRRGDRPGFAEWRSATIIGGALLLGGNGAVVWAEQFVPSSIAALLIATVPLWMVILGGAVLRERVSWREVLGLVMGFGGLALLIRPTAGHGFDAGGIAALLFASLSWAAGSLYARKATLPSRPLVGTAMQMIAGGFLQGVVGIAMGELGDLHPSEFSFESLLGLAYLVTFGSMVGYAAYTWLLRVARTTLVSTYAYVNPVVAVFLGWVILDESITGRTLVAAAVILGGVALIVSARGQAHEAEPAGDVAGARVAPPDEDDATSGSRPRTRGSTGRSP